MLGLPPCLCAHHSQQEKRPPPPLLHTSQLGYSILSGLGGFGHASISLGKIPARATNTNITIRPRAYIFRRSAHDSSTLADRFTAVARLLPKQRPRNFHSRRTQLKCSVL